MLVCFAAAGFFNTNTTSRSPIGSNLFLEATNALGVVRHGMLTSESESITQLAGLHHLAEATAHWARLH